MSFSSLPGQGWTELGELALAFVLSALIGVEREIRHKSAGLRTYTVVGFAAALIMLISKYGFSNVLEANRVVLDPSRVAAQVVSGIGFIGGGLIFVRRASVRGLTTAAIVWLTAAVGMACGAGLPLLAVAVTAGHFVVVFAFPALAARLPRSRWAPSVLQISYEDGRDILREVLVTCTEQGFSVASLRVERRVPGAELVRAAVPAGQESETGAPEPLGAAPGPAAGTAPLVTVVLELIGAASLHELATRLAAVNGVASVHAGDINLESE